MDGVGLRGNNKNYGNSQGPSYTGHQCAQLRREASPRIFICMTDELSHPEGLKKTVSSLSAGTLASLVPFQAVVICLIHVFPPSVEKLSPLASPVCVCNAEAQHGLLHVLEY